MLSAHAEQAYNVCPNMRREKLPHEARAFPEVTCYVTSMGNVMTRRRCLPQEISPEVHSLRFGHSHNACAQQISIL